MPTITALLIFILAPLPLDTPNQQPEENNIYFNNLNPIIIESVEKSEQKIKYIKAPRKLIKNDKKSS